MVTTSSRPQPQKASAAPEDGAFTPSTHGGRAERSLPGPGAASKQSHHRRRWTAEEDDLLTVLSGEMPLAALAERLARTPRALYNRAGDLGIPRGAPPGHETLTAAARRTGYAVPTLRTILRAAGAPLSAPLALPSKTTRRSSVVEIAAVDRAVGAWLARETPKGAGRRLGMSAERVENALAAAGHVRPESARGTSWRLPSVDIDAAIAAYERPGLAIAAHAIRLRLHPRTLAKRLRAAALLGPARPGFEVRLPIEAVDDALRRFPVARRRRTTGPRSP